MRIYSDFVKTSDGRLDKEKVYNFFPIYMKHIANIGTKLKVLFCFILFHPIYFIICIAGYIFQTVNRSE